MKPTIIKQAIESVEIAFTSIEFWYRFNAELGSVEVQRLFLSSYELKGITLEKKEMTLEEGEAFIWNHLNGILCAFWIALDEALQDGFGDKCPDKDSLIDDVRAVVFMFRCAFAHKISRPTWKVEKPAYRRRPYHLSISSEYEISGLKELYFDFAALNTKQVKNEEFGRFPGLFFFAEITRKLLIKRLMQLTDAVTEEAPSNAS